MKRLILLLIALPAFGQINVPWRASVTSTVSASASYVFTVQQNGANVQNIQAAVITCGANTFTVGQSQNGAAATATALTQTTTGTLATSANGLLVLGPNALNTQLTLTAWTASNVGVGTAVSGVQAFSGIAILVPRPGSTYLASFASTSTAQNYTFTVTNTGSGSCSLVIDIYGVQTQ